MELINVNQENSFNPTPKLKSSPIPIFFVSFNGDDNICIHCGEKYTMTLIYEQKYCKKCLSNYLTNMDNDSSKHKTDTRSGTVIIDNINMYLDVYLLKKDLECSKYEISETKVSQNIQECCRNCLIILFFKQIIGRYHNFYYNYQDLSTKYKNVIESERYCKLCGKLLYQGTDHYIMREFKLCSNCYLISSGCIESTLTKKVISIVYLPWWENTSDCYCYEKLVFTSNCQKYCENCFIFLIGCRYCLTTNIIFGITNQSQCKKCKRVSIIILDNKKIISINSGNNVLDDFLISIRHDQLKIAKFANDLKNIDKYFVPSKICDYSLCEGGFGIVYLATLIDGSKYLTNYDEYDTKNRDKLVILKRFKNFQYAKNYFMSELKTNHHCYKSIYNVIKTFGFTKDPKLNDYILVIQYASEGDLHKYLQKKFAEINWKQKIHILINILIGLEAIHNANFIHRDVHSENILVDLPSKYYVNCKIGDLGLSRPANDTSSDNEIYGVIPYIAPEIFKGSAFSKESDIYSLDSKNLSPKFRKKPHPKAVYTSRPLSSYIFKCSSTNFSLNNYISKELEFDIDIESNKSNVLETKRNIEELNINSYENNENTLKLIPIYQKQ
ncbi:uncharacterized protein OCT59_026919 [Rhizophagus irregularis]|nr:hypothetical protein OCT59_026919 [Rhizophagus irregularis]